MCQACSSRTPALSRRRLLAGLGATAAAMALPGAAWAAANASCFDAVTLAGTAVEKLRRRPTAADAVAQPPPALPGAPVTGPLSGVIRRVELPADTRLVALTFDLCQTRGAIAGYDGAIVDYLRAGSVPATFFAGGLWLATHRERAVQLVADPLFVVGNHSWTHHDLHAAPAATVEKEILTTEAALEETRAAVRATCSHPADTVAAPRLFRFPYGSCAPAAASSANAVGATVIQWDVVSGDPDGTPAASIVRAVLGGVRPGSIVVMHANGRGTHTAEALRTIVPRLRAQGYRFVTVDRMLAAGRAVAAGECFIERQGDTARYDRPGGLKLFHALKKAVPAAHG